MQSLADVESKIASAEEKGMEKGMEKAAQAIALNMLKMKTEIADIAVATGLPQSIIEQLKNKGNER